ncbi:MAG: phenylalanine--tRNA ligase subunit alpha [Planctomycetes bacterium]|nr:phenylalanine--tRNA ligase subunit alpha [Planctomycetota bacterium]
MPDEILLNEAAYTVWQTVKERGPIELGEVVRITGIDQAQVSATAIEAHEKGFFEIAENEREELIVSDGANDLLKEGLPEQLANKALTEAGGEMPMSEFVEWAKQKGVPVNEVLKWGTARGWIERVKTNSGVKVALTERGREVGTDTNNDFDIFVLMVCVEKKASFLDELVKKDAAGLDRLRHLLGNRPELARIKKRITRTLNLTGAGFDALMKHVRVVKERNTLTPEDLESGAWREIKLRPYDVTLVAKDVYPAKIHPLRKIIEQTRRAFLEMGFAEVVSPMIESAFWNFDALFQPQDHPARDMQDTFYMRHPAEVPLPEKGPEKGVRNLLQQTSSGSTEQKVPDTFFDIVEQVRRTHEDGWETGSEGWGYTWSPERSKQVVLRTHTTAATIRALAANPDPPGKFFCVGWTYRNETISFKHLPVFHQVDGIVIDEEANLASLMGTLQEFYSKMGFGRVKFKPAFYPYTEPSVDVVVYMESRGKWLEMGGAGIFRPEVTLPLGCKYPVLAWGLGIERLAMLRFGLSDIRELYRPSLDALEGVPLCR